MIGWESIDDFSCRAPRDYMGPCPYIMKVYQLSSRDKNELSIECKVQWPCLSDACDSVGGIDYSAACPEIIQESAILFRICQILQFLRKKNLPVHVKCRGLARRKLVVNISAFDGC